MLCVHSMWGVGVGGGGGGGGAIGLTTNYSVLSDGAGPEVARIVTEYDELCTGITS